MSNARLERQGPVWWLRLTVFVAVIVSAAAVGWWAWTAAYPVPTKLLEQATTLAARDPAQAERLLQRAIVAAGGNFPEAEMALCRLCAERGDWKSALPLFARLDLGACSSVFLNRFGELALKERQTTEGIAALSEVRRRKTPESIAALDALFAYYRRQNQERQMLDCGHELAELGEGQPELWWKLLEMLDKRQLETEYLDTLRTAVERNLPARDKTEMRHRLVARLVDHSDAALARHELAPLLENEGLSPRVKTHQAAICRLEGRPDEALKLLNAALQVTGERPEVVRLRGLIHLDLGMYEDAAADFRKGIAEDPYDLVGHFKLAEAYRKLGQLDLAGRHQQIADQIRDKRQRINKLREAVKRNPNDRRLYEQLAELHRDLNDSHEALSWENRANALREPAGQP
jgi:tetratricopeptide (TPR) repeat protein